MNAIGLLEESGKKTIDWGHLFSISKSSLKRFMWLLYERNCKICSIIETMALEILESFDPIDGYCVEKKSQSRYKFFIWEHYVSTEHKNDSTIQEYTDYHTICFCF